MKRWTGALVLGLLLTGCNGDAETTAEPTTPQATTQAAEAPYRIIKLGRISLDGTQITEFQDGSGGAVPGAHPRADRP